MNQNQKERFADALDRLSGDEEMLAMLATITVEDAPGIMTDLQRSVFEKSLPDAARTAHALKGLLSTFEVGEPVSELEPLIKAALRNDEVEVVETHQRIRPKLHALVSEIQTIAQRA